MRVVIVTVVMHVAVNASVIRMNVAQISHTQWMMSVTSFL